MTSALRFLSPLVLVAALVGCGSDESDTSTTAETPAEASAPLEVPAGFKVVSRANSKGSVPFPQQQMSTGFQNPREMRVLIDADPSEPLSGSVSVTCFANAGAVMKEASTEFSADGSTEQPAELTMANPDECLVASFASYDDVDQTGSIRIRVLGR